jgi:putative membrane protein
MRMTAIQRYMFSAAVALATASVAAQIPNATGSSPAQSQTGGQVANLNPLDSSMNGAAGADTQLMKDKMFVHMISLDGFAEVHFGQLAAQKASSTDVKKLGQRLVDDRATLDNDLKPAADELGVPVPTKMAKTDQEEFDKLSALSGADFDKEYLTFSLKSHRKDLHEFHTEEAQTTDPELRDAVASLEKVVVGHLYMVNKLALANGVPSAHKPAQTTVAPASSAPPQ